MPSHRAQTTLGKIISARRTELDLTQLELAGRLGYKNTNFVSMLEHDHSQVPFERVPQIATVLEMDVQWFAERVIRTRYPGFADALLGSASSSRV